MEFSCAVVEEAARLLRAVPVREGLQEAEERHRYVLGVERGVAGFLQRAYRDAALGLVGGQFGSEEAVNDALARAADAVQAFEDHPTWLGRLAGFEMEVTIGDIAEAEHACEALDAFAHRMIEEVRTDGVEGRREWRFLSRLRRDLGCAAGPATESVSSSIPNP